ncbi:MAG: transketolase [Kiritimatiellia bacterium]|jgi:transketolase|nr:transketolase [Kiritimatiellia bacterium]MDP6848189.1 transketolase [Kiritimatiellia bacterium]
MDIPELEAITAETRIKMIRIVHKAQCGHLGGSLSAAEILTALYFRIMNIDPENPDMPDRDRFVLSKGHCTPGYYTTLYKRGYFSEEILDTFDQMGSILQGHPDMKLTPGVDMSSGSLGQGVSSALGIAMGGEANGDSYYTYALLGDGEAQEGQVWETAMYAGSNKIKRFIVILDRNKVQLSATTSDALNIEPLADKWKAFNWDVLECDGHDMAAVVETLERARDMSDNGPVVIIAHTVKGKGVSFMEGRWQWHGIPPNDEQFEQAMSELTPGDAQ